MSWATLVHTFSLNGSGQAKYGVGDMALHATDCDSTIRQWDFQRLRNKKNLYWWTWLCFIWREHFIQLLAHIGWMSTGGEYSPVLLLTSHPSRRSMSPLQNIPKTLSVLECVKTVPKRSLISIKQLNKKIPSVCVMRANIDPSFRPVTFVQLPLWFIAADAPHYHFLVKSWKKKLLVDNSVCLHSKI